jgi:transposase-like protein
LGHQAQGGAKIEIRQIKYLNKLVEQDHRAVKRIVRPMLGFKSFWSAQRMLAGIELMLTHAQERPGARSRRTEVVRREAVLFVGGLILPGGCPIAPVGN